MTRSIVIDLQEKIVGSRSSATEICRTAHVISRKLNLDDVRSWLTQELNGYPDITSIPEFRRVATDPKFLNPYLGECPILMSKSKLQHLLRHYPIGQAIGQVDTLLQGTTEDFGISYDAAIADHLRRELRNSTGFDFEVYGKVGRPALVQIRDGVSDRILNWLIDLEKEGIMGWDLNFSESDRVQAQNISGPVIFAHSVVGVQTGKGSMTIHNSAGIDTKSAIKAIRDAMVALPAKEQDDIRKLLNDAELASNSGDEEASRSFLKSIKSIAEGATGNLAAQGIIDFLRSMF